MTLRTEVIDFIRLCVLDYFCYEPDVRKITVMKENSCHRFVGIKIDVVYPVSIERACAAYDTVDLVPLAQQQFSEIRAVLSRDPCD